VIYNLINLDRWKEENSPHATGKATCLACGHEWVAVAPTGTVFLECPGCRTDRGVFRFPHERPGKHWACPCGFQAFYITPEGVYCPNCGEWQSGF
jgi:predicted RNA-binding Zn-ribbon protein involved in translation (DUF1610 family)